ncbi:hypothetical protein BH18ACT15_BH18ACT15_14680 [soil metagenome]
MRPRTFTYAESPELWETLASRSAVVWPEYNLHGDVLARLWDELFSAAPAFQLAFCGYGAYWEPNVWMRHRA